jgi:hypothetical protein
VAQIDWKRVTRFVLDREKGLQDCEDRILLCEKIYNGYDVALIYDKYLNTHLPDGTIQKGRVIRKYMNGVLVESEENIFSKYLKQITVDVAYNSTGWKLVPTESTKPLAEINFKTEVENALSKKSKPANDH